MEIDLFRTRRHTNNWRSVLARTLGWAWGTLQVFLQDSAENAVRNLARWGKSRAIIFGVGAALVLVALHELGSGLAALLTTLGLPPFAGHLIVAVAAGLAGFLLFKVGSRKRSTAREDEEKAAPQGLTLRFVKTTVARNPRGRRRSSPRVYDVHPRGQGWEITGGSSRSRRQVYRTKRRAVKAARRAARADSGEVVIRRNDGRIRHN
jgi:hypothetical protein